MSGLLKYLRISITDKCNLHCRYCDTASFHKLPFNAILSFEEIARIARIATGLGVETVRITGGEPLVRSNFTELFRMLKKDSGVPELTFTTNGMLLGKWAEPIFAAGVRRFNLSLDSLVCDTFRDLTGGGDLKAVLSGLDTCKKIGFAPIKINVVAMRGVNDGEFAAFVDYAAENGHPLRFIELMDIAGEPGFVKKHFIDIAWVRGEIEKRFTLVPFEKDERIPGAGPAEYYRVKGTGCVVGFISPVSRHFCEYCNRLRLTADGNLKSCLLRPREINILKLLRGGAADKEIEKVLKEEFDNKEKACGVTSAAGNFRKMTEIGG